MNKSRLEETPNELEGSIELWDEANEEEEEVEKEMNLFDSERLYLRSCRQKI